MFAQRRAKDVCASFSFLCSLLLLPSGKDHKANTEHSRLIRSLIFMNAYESVIIIMMCVCLRTSPVQNCLSFLSYVSLCEESAAGGAYTHTRRSRAPFSLYRRRRRFSHEHDPTTVMQQATSFGELSNYTYFLDDWMNNVRNMFLYITNNRRQSL